MKDLKREGRTVAQEYMESILQWLRIAGRSAFAAFLLLAGCDALESSDVEAEFDPRLPSEVVEVENDSVLVTEVSPLLVHWISQRADAIEVLRELVSGLPVSVGEPADPPETFVVGNWRREMTYAFSNGRFSELQSRERSIDFPSHAWFFTEDGTFRRTTERFAWSGRVTWTEYGPDEASISGWYLLELEEVITAPPELPFGDRQLALVSFSGDAMLIVLWEDTRRVPPDLVWRFVRYAGVSG